MHLNVLATVDRQPSARPGRRSAFQVLAWGAVVLALLMLYGGGGHLLAVTDSKIRQGKPYDFRFAMLVANGAFLLYAGLTNLVLSRWIARGRHWALAWSAAVTGALAGYCLLLLPVPTAREAAVPALALNLAYLAWLVVVWWCVRTDGR